MINISPADYMLNRFKCYMSKDYTKCFLKTNDFLNEKIRENFAKTVVNYLNIKDVNFHYKNNINTTDIFYKSTLIRTYENMHFKNEISLKFQLLLEWGGLLSESEKQLLLIAL